MNFEMSGQNVFFGYLLTINIITFFLFGIDKWKAIRDQWRIPEKTLLLSSLIGGSVGGMVSMRLFHHKTQNPLFRYGMPAIFILQILMYLYFT